LVKAVPVPGDFPFTRPFEGALLAPLVLACAHAELEARSAMALAVRMMVNVFIKLS
jgi:hypothetical protein